MKKFGNVFLIILAIGGFLFYKFVFNETIGNKPKPHFTITADTNVSKVKGLSKYVTQEEVNDFGFRYWDIDNNYTKDIPPNLIPLRTYLKQKNTNKIIEYIKDNNLSIDVKIQDGTTPLMYSSFYNDVKTSKYLIKNKANVHQKDKYGLSPLAYAIENNSTKTVKLLLDSGVKVDELKKVQFYLEALWYTLIRKIEIDENNNTIIYYDYRLGEKNIKSKDGVTWFGYLETHRFLEMLKIVLDSGYRPKRNTYKSNMPGLGYDGHNISDYNTIVNAPNYKPLLELLLKYNVYGKPTKEELKRAYDYCHMVYKRETKRYNNYNEKLKPNQILDKKTTTDDIIWKKRIDNYAKYCKEKNSTFTIRNYFSWANEDEKAKRLFDFNRQHSTKVSYIKSNSTKETNTTNKKQQGINHGK